MDLGCHENLGGNSNVDKETTNHTSKISSNGSNQPSKTLRGSFSRPSFPTQVSRVQSVEMRRRMGSATCQPIIKDRAISAEPRAHRSTMGFMRTNVSTIRKTAETGVRIQGPLRVRSASTSGTTTKNIGAKAKNAVGTNRITMAQRQNGANLTTKTVVGAERMISKSEATRKLLYVGPETRARARMKQRYLCFKNVIQLLISNI